MEKFDCVIVGGGIAGLSVAWAILKRHPNIRVAVLEKGNIKGWRRSSLDYQLRRLAQSSQLPS
jgi:L-2-hydroxyglutarate oxidase LhgO